MLTENAEKIVPLSYPSDEAMNDIGLRCTLVEGVTEQQMGLIAIHNFFDVGIQAIPMHKWKIPGLESKPNCFTAVKGLKKNQVRMFYKEKGLEDNEMKMVIAVMSLFKHMHTLSHISLEIKRLIK